MVTAVTLALALAFEPTEADVMQRPPRPPNEPLLSSFLVWRITFVSLLLLATTFGHFLWLQMQEIENAVARTAAINTLVVGQAFYLLNSRYLTRPALSREALTGNRAIWTAIAILAGLRLLFTYAPPLQYLFNTAALSPADWTRVFALGLLVFLVIEFEKGVLRSRDVASFRATERSAGEGSEDHVARRPPPD